MPVDWGYASAALQLGGQGNYQIAAEDALRQERTAAAVLESLADQPGVILADEVGMGKTYVALAVAASVLLATRGTGRPIMVMMPPGLAPKWQNEWRQFKSICCARHGALDWVRDVCVERPTELFRALSGRRPHLVWMPTNCFSRGLQDPWVKLGLIRMARSRTRMDEQMKERLFRLATSLVRLKSYSRLTPEVIERLMVMDIGKWRAFLVAERIFSEEVDEPIPESLQKEADELNWKPLIEVLRGETLDGFNEACQGLYKQWLNKADWRASLLVLDEAHHAKNDGTRLAGLFRSEDVTDAFEAEREDRPLLWEKFDRMLFLTATPFQLGHHELIRVLRSFAAARWSRQAAPGRPREEFLAALDDLEDRLDTNRIAGQRLDRLWGKLTPATVGAKDFTETALADAATMWWRERSAGTDDPYAREVVRAVEDCKRTKARAESDDGAPWSALRKWVIRHNRSPWLPRVEGTSPVARREARHGDAVLAVNGVVGSGGGLSLAGDSALPFLLAARAQGELAAAGGKARAFFAEGLCSSYEAFHHTREGRGDVRDANDEGEEVAHAAAETCQGIVPAEWYEAQVGRLIPSRDSHADARMNHPKVRAVVDRVVQLWLAGEKVLIFCFYRETVKALDEHIKREIERATTRLAARKLKLDPDRESDEAHDWLARIARRLADRDSPFHRALIETLRQPLVDFPALAPYAGRLVELLAAYVRSPSFVARYLPLEEPDVRLAFSGGQTGVQVIQAGVAALRHALTVKQDDSAMSMLRRVEEFLRFARELAERGGGPDTGQEEAPLLIAYLDSVAVYSSRLREDGEGAGDGPEGTYRAGLPVRMVYGDTGRDVRERLMLAFNSPLFPEVLVSSAVLGEGVDLHRFCRHVIHHDLCWNPSTLEQRTGRLDRIRCKAELARRSIVVFEPFLAGSADEKMFRVVRDRERWFQIVMGQRFEFNEATSEQLAARVPLPDELARELIFDLTRWDPKHATEASVKTLQETTVL